MNSEQTIRDIRNLFTALTNRSDQDIILVYKGTSYGVKLPWVARIDSHEVNAISVEVAIETLRDNLKASLSKKANDLARDANALRRTLDAMKD